MRRCRRLLRRVGGFAGALALAVGPAAAEPADRERTPVDKVVLITIDTLRADHVAAYGGPVPTPAIDRLAAEGVLVEQAFTPTPSTGPAHASLMTGLHPWRHGTLSDRVPMDPQLPTLAEAAADRGLATAAFVSSYLLSKRFGFHQGFQTFGFEPTEEYWWRGKRFEKAWARGEATAQSAMDWITAHAGGPFFVWVHYFDPHWPYQPPQGFARPADEPIDLTGKGIPKDRPAVRTRRDLGDKIRAYRGEVTYANAQVGKIVERLQLLGILDRTAVILTADHGEGLGDHGRLEHLGKLFEELVRVPLVIRAPGLPAGRRLLGAAQLEDLRPTIQAMIGAELDGSIDGKNLLPWLRGEVASSPRDAVLGRRIPRKGKRELFYFRRWPTKWIGRLDAGGREFALDRDPREIGGRSGGGAPEPLRRSVEQAAANEDGGEPANELDPEAQRALRAMGYSDE
jgi:arylsulfatase A-like enzyme